MLDYVRVINFLNYYYKIKVSQSNGVVVQSAKRRNYNREVMTPIQALLHSNLGPVCMCHEAV